MPGPRPRSRGARQRPPPRRPRRRSRNQPLRAAARAGASAVRWSAGTIRTAPAEAWGLATVLVGVVAALGIWGHGGGPVGGGLEFLSTLLFGRMGVVVPLLVGAAGILVIISVTRPYVGRIVTGALIGTIAVSGMVHIARGNKLVSAPLHKLQVRGGIGGALVGRPVSELVGTWATWPLLVLLLLLGVMVLTHTSVRRVVDWIRDGTGAAREFFRGLTARVEVDDYEDEPAEIDEYGDDGGYEDDVGDEEVDQPEAPARAGPAGKPQQLAMPVGDTRSYKLPPIELLARGGEQQINSRSIEQMIVRDGW